MQDERRNNVVTVVAKAVYIEDKVYEAKELIQELVEETCKEKGCISYKLFQDINDPKILTLIEEWENRESLDMHIKSDHYNRIIPFIRELRIDTEINIYEEVIY